MKSFLVKIIYPDGSERPLLQVSASRVEIEDSDTVVFYVESNNKKDFSEEESEE